MKQRMFVVGSAVLAGVCAYVVVGAVGLEVSWPPWVSGLAVALVVSGSMLSARKTKRE